MAPSASPRARSTMTPTPAPMSYACAVGPKANATPPSPHPTPTADANANETRLNRLRHRPTAPVRREQEWQKTLVSIMETRDESGGDDDRKDDKSLFTFDELWEVLVDRKYDDFEEYRSEPVAKKKAALDELKALRDKAREQGRLYHLKSEERKRALRAGDEDAAAQLNKLVRRYKAEQGKLDAKASKGLFEYYNRHLPMTTIDLHGQHSREAVEFVKERIEALLALGKKAKLRIITGKGLHSVLGKPVLKPSIIAYLESLQLGQGIRAYVHEDARNAGALIVSLPSTQHVGTLVPVDSDVTSSSSYSDDTASVLSVSTGGRVSPVFQRKKNWIK